MSGINSILSSNVKFIASFFHKINRRMIKFYEIKKIQDSQTKILRKIDRYLYREANVFENTRVTQKWYRIISDSPHLSRGNNQKGSRPCSNRQMRGRRRATAKCVATPCWRVSDRHNIWNCPRSGWTGSVSRVTIGRCECKCVPNRDSAHPSDILLLLIKTYVQNRKSESSLSYIFLLSVSFFFFFDRTKTCWKEK